MFWSLDAFTKLNDTPVISMKVKGKELGDVLKQIEDKSGYTFYFSSNIINHRELVSLEVQKVSLNVLLSELLLGRGVEWVIRGKSIVLRRANRAFKISSDSDSVPGRKVISLFKGKVVDSTGRPVIGASVSIGKSEAVTNSMGFFSLANVALPAVLKVTSIGFTSFKKKIVTEDDDANIILEEQVTELKNIEIVSTGYQELDKNKITGSVYKIDNELYNRQPGSNVVERIKYITSGLIFNTDRKNPGILIRGRATFSGITTPLIVLDNFPYEGPIESINPNDVESITVLKDAAAAAIWGTKAGNGVIVITTKKGRFNSRPEVALTSNVSITDKTDLFYQPIISSTEMIEFEKYQFSNGVYDVYEDVYPSMGYFPALPKAVEILLKARKDGVVNPVNDPSVLSKLSVLSRHDMRSDIDKYFMRKPLLQQYAISLKGGSDRVNYFASIGFDQNLRENKGSDNKRITLDLKNTYKVSSKLDFSLELAYTNGKDYTPASGYTSLLNSSPYNFLADGQGASLEIPYVYRSAYVDTARYPALNDWKYRPIEEIDRNYQRRNLSDTRITTAIRFQPTAWMKAELQYQNQLSKLDFIDVNKANSFTVRDGVNRSMGYNSMGQIEYPWPQGDLVSDTKGSVRNWGGRASISIDKTFKEHRISGIIGADYREYKSESIMQRMYGYDFNTNSYRAVNPLQDIPTRPSGSIRIGLPSMPSGYLNRTGSIFSNFVYSLKGTYFLSLSGRIDQSNNFGMKANLRRKPLWSTGLSWNISDEPFFEVSWIDFIKLRSSYGFTGQAITSATTFSTFEYQEETSRVPPREGLKFAVIRTPNNPNLKWERFKIINLGFDFSIFKDRVSGSLEFYRKNGLDLLGPITLDPTSGFRSYIGNNAKIKSRGWDVVLNAVNLRSKSFKWSTNILFNYNRNRVVSFDDNTIRDPFSVLTGNIDMIGYPQRGLFTFKSAGLDPIDGSPRVIASDTITSYTNLYGLNITDLKYHGTREPRFFGSILNNFKWKQISMSIGITYKLGYYFMRNSVQYSDLLAGAWTSHEDFSNRWRQKGDEYKTVIPSIPTSIDFARDQAYLFSDVLVEKGAHIRLQDVRLTYALSESLISHLKFVKALNVFVYAGNLGLIWKANKRGIDPDAFDFGSYPNPRTYTMGLNANF